MYIYVYVYIRMYTYVYVCIYMYTYVYACTLVGRTAEALNLDLFKKMSVCVRIFYYITVQASLPSLSVLLN